MSSRTPQSLFLRTGHRLLCSRSRGKVYGCHCVASVSYSAWKHGWLGRCLHVVWNSRRIRGPWCQFWLKVPLNLIFVPPSLPEPHCGGREGRVQVWLEPSPFFFSYRGGVIWVLTPVIVLDYVHLSDHTVSDEIRFLQPNHLFRYPLLFYNNEFKNTPVSFLKDGS